MSYKSAEYPVLLLPLKIETRFVTRRKNNEDTQQLWIRIFPDQPFLKSFNPILTAEERKDREKFNRDRNIDEWKFLVEKYGQYRASWIIHISDEELLKQGNKPPLENLTDFLYSWLPDYFMAYLYWKDQDKETRLQEIQFSPIDTTQNLPLLDPEKNWLEDFFVAEEMGMAKRISIDKTITKFERIIVIGIRSEEVDPSSALVRDLLRNHQYTEGFSFLAYGTPTNNLKGLKSGFSSQEEYDAIGSYSYAVDEVDLKAKPLESDDSELQSLVKEYPNPYKTFAENFSHALGFDINDFKHVKNANGSGPRLGKLIQKATWFALGGQMLRMLFGDNISNEAQLQLWKFYCEFVDVQGPYPAIKIGNLPYGVLPVTHLRGILQEEKDDTVEDRINLALVKLFEKWLEMARSDRPEEPEHGTNEDEFDAATNYVPRMEDAENKASELARILSMEPRSTNFQLRMLELERVPGWYSNLVTTPQSIYAFTPLLIDEMLKGKPNYDRDLTYTLNNFKEIDDLFTSFFFGADSDKNILNYAPVLSFKTISEIPFTEWDTSNDHPIPLTFSNDWYETAYLDFIKDIWKEDKEFLIWYKGELSILVDLLLRGYSQAVRLYYRDVYFNPSKEEVEGVAAYRIHKIVKSAGSQVAKGEDIIMLDLLELGKTIAIKAPFSGVIEKVFVIEDAIFNKEWEKANDKIWDRRLFRLKDEKGFKNICREMAAVGAQIILEIQRLAEKQGIDHVKEQKIALTEALDLNSFRLDAWLTGIAAQRINTLRKAKPEGFYFGAYGWIENLEKNDNEIIFNENGSNTTGEFLSEDAYDEEGGIIHCPSSAQAVAASMFRQSFSSYRPEKDKNGKVISGSPYTINLTSDRIQKSKQFMEGIRQGQDIEALLGYRFERFLHDHQKGEFVYDLRKKFPLTFNKLETGDGEEPGIPEMTVVNGLDLIEKRNADDPLLEDAKVQEGIDLIANILDGSADLLFFEAGYQMTQGNFSHAAAAMDAAKGKVEPPQIEALDTRIPGTAIEHKLVMLFDPPANELTAPEPNPKAYIEPTLEQWLSECLGPFDKIGCQVKLYQEKDEGNVYIGNGEVVTLQDLNIGALDLMQLSFSPLAKGATELEYRIMQVVLKQKGELAYNIRYEFSTDVPVGMQTIQDAIETLQYVHVLLRESQFLKVEDIATNEELNIAEQEEGAENITYDPAYIPALAGRFQKCVEQLKNSRTPLSVLSKYDVQNAKGLIYVPMAFVYENTIQNFLGADKDITSISPEDRKEFRDSQEGSLLLQKLGFVIDDKLETEIAGIWEELEAAFYNALEARKRSRTEALKKANQVENLLESFNAGYSENQHISFSSNVNQLQDIAQILFGKTFYLIPPFIPTSSFKTAINANQDQLVGPDGLSLGNGITGGQERIRHWLEGRSVVDIQTEAFSNFLMSAENWRSQDTASFMNPYLEEWKFHIAQYTQDETFPWAALDENELKLVKPSMNSVDYPEDVQSIVVFKQSKNSLQEDLQYGLLIDQFPEIIPSKKVDTGLTFQYNAPNNEAPQAFLLAVASEDLNWNEDRLRDIIYDTIDLAKVRMVDTDALQGFGNILPMSYWFNVPDLL